jgi:hypothetical protein
LTHDGSGNGLRITLERAKKYTEALSVLNAPCDPGITPKICVQSRSSRAWEREGCCDCAGVALWLH